MRLYVLCSVVCRRAHVLFVRLYLQLLVGELMSCLYCLCLFAHSGVQHILCCVFVLFFIALCTLCCQFLWIVFVLFFIALCTLCCQFLWIVFVLFVIALWYSMLPVSLDCFCFVFHRLLYPMLPVFLDCPFLIARSVFSKFNSKHRIMQGMIELYCKPCFFSSKFDIIFRFIQLLIKT